jgi:hypothetical protein
MVDWQVTATTIYCDVVDADVTLVVYKDWTTKCVVCKDYGEIARGIGKTPTKKRKKLSGQVGCEGLTCPRIVKYRDKLFAEEKIKNG